MIQANELRIGNWIEIRNNERPAYYYQVTGHDIDTIDSYGEGFEGGNYPIPLTHELLEKAGFTLPDENGYLQEVPNGVIRCKLTSLGYLQIKIGGLVFLGYKFLHELQNVYFALVFKELIIKM